MTSVVRIIQNRCTCGKRLGKFQCEIEKLLEKGSTINEVCRDLDLNKMCCRANIYNPNICPITDANATRMFNQTDSEDVVEYDNFGTMIVSSVDKNTGPRIFFKLK